MNLHPPKPVIVVDLFPNLLDELVALLNELNDEDWNTPTACSPWSVKDICAHLLGVDIGNLSWKRDGFSVFREIESHDHLVQLLNEHNAHWVKSTQHFSPRFMIDTLRFTGSQVIEYFSSLDPFAPGVPVDWVGPGPVLNWLDIAREYTERWHHQQHIRDAVDKPGLTDERYLAPILDTFILALPRTFRHVTAKGEPAIQVITMGSVTRNWTLVYQAPDWRLYEGTVDKPQSRISLPADTAWRVFTKGISIEDARQHAEISGNQALALKVLETISIIA